MRNGLLISVAVIVATLSGCAPEPDIAPGYEQPRQIAVTRNRTNYVAYVDTQSGEMSSEERYRLVRNLGALGTMKSLSVTIQDTPPAGHTQRLMQALVESGVARERISILAPTAVFAELPGGPPPSPHPQLKAVTVAVDHFTAEIPGCPDWRKANLNDGGNGYSSNFGCSDLSNFTRMIVNPGDIVGGVSSRGPSDGARAGDAVKAYQERKVALPPPPDQLFVIRPGQ